MATADTAGGQDGNRRDLLDHLRPQHDRADLAAVPTGLAALGDDDVNAGVGVLASLRRRSAQRRDLAALVVDVLDHVRGRGAQRVGDQRHLRVLQGHFDLRSGGRLGPAEQLQGVVVAVVDGHTVVGKDLAGEVQMLLGYKRIQRLLKLVGGHVRIHALVLVGDDDVDAIRMVTDVLVDPVQLDLELLRGEADRAEHTEATCLAHGDDDVTAVGEREDRELDVELVADGGVHACSSGGRRRTETCSSLA